MAYIISELKHKIIPYPKDNLNSGWDKKRKKRFTSINSIWKRNVALAYNGQVLPKVGRKSATASPKHKSLIVALMLIVGWSAPLLAIHC